MSCFSAGNPEPDNPLQVHEAKLTELHTSIHAMVRRAAGDPLHWKIPRYQSAQPYHPAFVAARMMQLETMLGVLASFMLKAGIMSREELVDFIGQTYVSDIQELELRAAALGATVFLGASKAQRERDRTERAEAEDQAKREEQEFDIPSNRGDEP